MNPGEIAGRSFIFDSYILLLYMAERFIERFLDKYFLLVEKVYSSKTSRSISSLFPLVDCFRNLYEKLENVRRDKRNSLKKKVEKIYIKWDYMGCYREIWFVLFL